MNDKKEMIRKFRVGDKILANLTCDNNLFITKDKEYEVLDIISDRWIRYKSDTGEIYDAFPEDFRLIGEETVEITTNYNLKVSDKVINLNKEEMLILKKILNEMEL